METGSNVSVNISARLKLRRQFGKILDRVVERCVNERAAQWALVAEAREFHERRTAFQRHFTDLEVELARLRAPVPSWSFWVCVGAVVVGAVLTLYWLSNGGRP